MYARRIGMKDRREGGTEIERKEGGWVGGNRRSIRGKRKRGGDFFQSFPIYILYIFSFGLLEQCSYCL